MGYQTYFTGSVSVVPALNEHEISYLKDFSNTRRMNRANGPYFVKGAGFAGQDSGPDEVFNYNDPPPGQPGLWCQWEPTADGTEIRWNDAEKFYNSAHWFKYIVDHFFKPGATTSIDLLNPQPTEEALKADPRFAHFTYDHTLNGEIEAEGEDSDDRWKLIVVNNVCYTAQAVLTYGDPVEL